MEASKNEPRNELERLVTRLVPSLHSMSARVLDDELPVARHRELSEGS